MAKRVAMNRGIRIDVFKSHSAYHAVPSIAEGTGAKIPSLNMREGILVEAIRRSESR